MAFPSTPLGVVDVSLELLRDFVVQPMLALSEQCDSGRFSKIRWFDMHFPTVEASVYCEEVTFDVLNLGSRFVLDFVAEISC